jgi:hypothetical protein
MAGLILELIPGVSLGGEGRLYLTPKARRSVLKYKWRDFSRLPPNFKTEGTDKIIEPAALVISPISNVSEK